MRWKFPVLVFVLLMITALPFMAAAQEDVPITEPLDFKFNYPGESGEGWSWNAETQTLTLSGINLAVKHNFAVQLPDGAVVVLAGGTDNAISNSTGSGIVCAGSLNISGGGKVSISANSNGIRAMDGVSISGCGEVSIHSDDFVGIYAYNDNGNSNVSISDCSKVSISANHKGIINAEGDVSIGNCGEVSISSVNGDGIETKGDVSIGNCDEVSISSEYDGIDAYDNKNVKGNVSFSDCSKVFISADDNGINALGDVSIGNCGEVSISANVGILAYDGNVSIGNCDEVSISSEDGDGIDAFDNVSVISCGKVSISSEVNNGIGAFGNVSIISCGEVSIQAYQSGIYSDECDVNISDCSKVSISANYYGITCRGGGVTITNSALTVSGKIFGICTGFNKGIGGDIVINNSFVDASCDPDGYAAIFAGDNIPYEGEGHAKILLNGCAIAAPAGGRVLDVNINGGVNCQSITGEAGIEEITDWEQTAKTVDIKPLYTLAYNANGGSGSMADASSPYIAGTMVTVLPCGFTTPAGYTFSGWNTAADGSGTSYAPNAAFAIAGDITLYAQYTIDSFTVTFVDWDGSELKKETVAYGDKASAPSPPVKAGYNFTGWDKDFDKVTQDLIVTAQYDINSFTVRFDPQGGSAVAAVTVPYNSIITAPTAPTRKGYTFGGWYKDADCKNAWNFATDKVTADITLYAKWTPSAELPATAGWSAASEVSLAAISLVGGLLMLVLYKRRKKYA